MPAADAGRRRSLERLEQRAGGGLVRGSASNQIALVGQVRGDRGERRAAAVELLHELAFDARHGFTVVGAEAAALDDCAADSGDSAARRARRGHQQVG